MDKNSKDSVCSSIDWLSRNLMYYLRIDKCGYMGQFNAMLVGLLLSFILKYFYKFNDNFIKIKI